MSKHFLIAIALLFLANTLAWFQVNLQFISEWWYSRPLLTIFSLALPTTFCFYFGWRYLVEFYNQEVWTARVISFSISILLFLLYSYLFKLQSLNLKTGICIILSFAIILVQSYWPDSKEKESEVEEASEEK